MAATKKTTPRARRSTAKRPTAHPKPKKRATATRRTSKHISTRTAPTRKRAAALKTAPAGKPPRKHAPAKKIAKAKAPTKRILAKPARKGSPAKPTTRKRVPAKTARKRKALRGGGRLPKFKSKPRVMSDAEALVAAPNGVAVGRPRIKINWKQVEQWASEHCTVDEIASKAGITPEGLRERPEFFKIYEKHWNSGRMSLRRLQWRAARSLNPTMLIWMGKQILGQTDRQELTGADGGPLQIEQRNVLDLSKLSDVELDRLQALVEKASDDSVVDAEFETISSQQQALAARPPAS